jgi:hypothetical protein
VNSWSPALSNQNARGKVHLLSYSANLLKRAIADGINGTAESWRKRRFKYVFVLLQPSQWCSYHYLIELEGSSSASRDRDNIWPRVYMGNHGGKLEFRASQCWCSDSRKDLLVCSSCEQVFWPVLVCELQRGGSSVRFKENFDKVGAR